MKWIIFFTPPPSAISLQSPSLAMDTALRFSLISISAFISVLNFVKCIFLVACSLIRYYICPFAHYKQIDNKERESTRILWPFKFLLLVITAAFYGFHHYLKSLCHNITMRKCHFCWFCNPSLIICCHIFNEIYTKAYSHLQILYLSHLSVLTRTIMIMQFLICLTDWLGFTHLWGIQTLLRGQERQQRRGTSLYLVAESCETQT